MIIFATSDKGGTGRSVTSANMIYRRALEGDNVAYLDFDFGSPTSGAIFGISGLAVGSGAERGVRDGSGLHNYFRARIAHPTPIDVWERGARLGRGNAGQLVLYPGDSGPGEFNINEEVTDRCVALFHRMEEQFDFTLVDLSAGRSYALDLVLRATRRLDGVESRWLVYHRWTRQNLIAVEGLVKGTQGILDAGARVGWDQEELDAKIRYVRTAVITIPVQATEGMREQQRVFLTGVDRQLQELAATYGMAGDRIYGQVPLDPMLQWREQLVTNEDVRAGIANQETIESFELLAKNLDSGVWRS